MKSSTLTRNLLGLLCAAVLIPATGRAAVIAYNGFDGSPSGFSSNFSSANATGLTFGSLTTTGNGSNQALNLPSGNTVAQLNSAASGTVFMSWLYNPGNSNSFGGLRVGSNTSGDNMLWFSPRDDTGLLQISRRGTSGGNAASSTGQTLSFGTTYFLVAKFDVTATTLDFWFNPTPGGTLGAATVSLTSAQLPTAGLGFSYIALLGGNSGGATYDEIRLGTTYADVAPIPEPSTLALALLGGLGAMGMIRRRKV